MKTLVTRTLRLAALVVLVAALAPVTGAHAQFSSATKITQDAENNPLSQADDNFGAAVANLGGDPTGLLDDPLALLAAVGAPGVDSDQGVVYGLGLDGNGNPTAVTAAGGLITISPNGVLTTIEGDDAGDRFGASFAATVSVTPGDAIAAGFVGAPGDDSETGEAYIYGLNINTTTFTIDATREETYNETTISGLSLSSGDRFGAAIDTLGNFGGDSTTEIAVGAPGTNGGEGTVYVLSVDQSDGSATLFATLDNSTLGMDSGDGLGSGLANLGDLTADGNFEVAVGAEDDGIVHLISIASDGSASVLGTYTGDDNFGASAGNATSISGDSTIVVGNPDDGSGSFTHLAADGSGFSFVGSVDDDNVPGSSLSDDDRFADALAGVPEDLDDNSFGEVFAGAPGDDENGSEAGAAYMLFPDQAALPVEFDGAPQASVSGTDVTLSWTTLSETDNAGFYVQHRRHGQSTWSTANEALIEGHGTATTAHTYRYTTEDLAPGSYTFRVKQVDLNDGQSFSPTVEVDVSAGGFALHAPTRNPFRSSTSLSYSVPDGTDVRAALYNTLGQQVRRLDAGNGRIAVTADGLASGVYFVRLLTDDGRVEVRQVTLVR